MKLLIRAILVALAVTLLAAIPNNLPVLVGEGVISTMDDESGFALSPDGNTALFGLTAPATSGGDPPQVICIVRKGRDGRWKKPEIAPFSGVHHDAGPSWAPDGSRLYFVSDRPIKDEDKQDLDIWSVDRVGDGWSEPHPLPPPVNSPANEYGISVAASGTIYFSSNRSGGTGSYDLYRSRLEDGEYRRVENLGDGVNTNGPEIQPAISPDETILVYTAIGRPDEMIGVHKTYAHGDLYVAESVNGGFPTSRHIGPPINSGGGESWPGFSGDGKMFFFTSDRGFATNRLPLRLEWPALRRRLQSTLNGMGNIWQLDARGLKGLK